MITVKEKLGEIISSSPLVEEALSEGLLNLSAFARKIKPEIESAIFKEVSESAIVMALRRIAAEIKERNALFERTTGKIKDIVVRANLCEFTFLKSEFILERWRELLHQGRKEREAFFAFTQGAFEITIIVNAALEGEVKEIFSEEKLISSIAQLSAISIRLPQDTVQSPGVYYSILKQLAWQNINLIEVVSTLTEFTVILENREVDRAFSILLKYFAKKNISGSY